MGVHERVVSRLRRVKHEAFLAQKRLTRLRNNAIDWALEQVDERVPYSYPPERFADSPSHFLPLHRNEGLKPGDAPNVIYVFWTGDNDLTPMRSQGLTELKERNPETPVVMVTPDNLGDYLVPGYPLHPSYFDLAFVHRSDYLRSYFMHHHGGGYSDIKAPTAAWRPAFQRLNDVPDAWVVGYQERAHKEAAWMDDRFGRHLRFHFPRLLGQCAFICRSNSPLTADWYFEIQRRMDALAPALAERPSRTPFGEPGYPVPWTYLHAQVFQPLHLKYQEHILRDERVAPVLSGNHR